MLRKPVSLSGELIGKSKAGWLLRGRWIFAAALGLLGVVAAFRDAADLSTLLLLVALAFSVANLIYATVDHHAGHGRGERSYELPITFELLGDILILSVLLYFTGGLQSPFLLLLLAPAIAATFLLRTSLSPLVVLICLFFPLATRAGVEAGFLQSHAPPDFFADSGWLPGVTLALAIGLCCYFCLQVRQKMREQEVSLSEAEQKLYQGQAALQRAHATERSLREQVGDLSQQSMVAEMSTRLAHRIKEPLGIVQARAESLRFHFKEGADVEEAERDVRVLQRNLESVHRGLRGILAFLPPSAISDDVDLNATIALETCRLGIGSERFFVEGRRVFPRLRGSHDEIELAVGLVFRIMLDHSHPESRITIVVHRRHHRSTAGLSRARFELRFKPNASLQEDQSLELRLAVLDRVVRKHGGELGHRIGGIPQIATMIIDWPHAGRQRLPSSEQPAGKNRAS